MLNRCDSRQRNYTELCNRSSTRSLSLGHLGIPLRHDCDMSEDYWEDASVSLRSHSLDSTSTPWLRGTMSALELTDEEDANKRITGLSSPLVRHHRYSFDVNEYMASLKGRRTFPPPLASCSTLSIKEGGRFVLKEMDADRPQGFFRAQRGNGRLRLQLVLPDEVNDEEDNPEESPSPVEDTVESAEFDHAEHDEHVEEITSGNHEDCSIAAKYGGSSSSMDTVGGLERFVNSEGLWGEGHVGKVEDFEIERPTVQIVGPEGMELNACSTSQNVGMDVVCTMLDKSSVQQVCLKNSEFDDVLDGFYSDDRHRSNHGKEVAFLEPNGFLTDSYHTYGKLELNQFVTESSSNNAEQESLWNVDVSNQVLASSSAWSSKQMCLDQSIVQIRPALGLAMS